MSFVQYPRALVRLACAENNLVNYLDDGGRALRRVDSKFHRIIDLLYYNYMECTDPNPLFSQEQWLSMYDDMYQLSIQDQELTSMLEEWHDAVGEYRTWVVDCGIEPSDIMATWNEIFDTV
ncbi:hypothetical protein EB118_16750 [bacterium]|nr:hypothetical protein [Actinomycetota bacterium]NDG31705.1 hypothetical protein [bacterium]